MYIYKLSIYYIVAGEYNCPIFIIIVLEAAIYTLLKLIICTNELLLLPLHDIVELMF